MKVLEFAARGPVAYGAMILSDLGADVVTVARSGKGWSDPRNFVARGRSVVEADLKDPVVTDKVRGLAQHTDVLIEGFRPGVMERLGLAPDLLMEDNPGLIFARMTGWGQEGPLSSKAGHDINFTALSGALDAIRGKDGAPVFPVNFLGDYAGGSLFLLVGILAALHERTRSGRGQVIDAAIVDGVVSLLTPLAGLAARGWWDNEPGNNLLDGGAPFYNTYRCRDGKWVAMGAAEPEFFAQLMAGLEIDDPTGGDPMARAGWAELESAIAEAVATKDRSAWVERFAGLDACVTPVYTVEDAARDPHLAARSAFVRIGGRDQPAPAPRMSRTPARAKPCPFSDLIDINTALDGWRPRA